MQDTEHINFIADCLANYKIKIQKITRIIFKTEIIFFVEDYLTE